MPSKAYDTAVAEAAAHHASSKTYSGKFLRPHKPVIAALVAELGIASGLDWGCGKGVQYDWIDPEDGKTMEEAWGFTVFKHDPAWPPFAAEPPADQQFGLVICTHVLGSIPVNDLPWFLAKLGRHLEPGGVLYIAEKLGPVRKRALSSPDLRPVGWTAGQWQAALAVNVGPLSHYTLLSTREVAADGETVLTRRWRLSPGEIEWQLVFTTAEDPAQ